MALISKRARYAMHGLAYVASRPPSLAVPLDDILRYLRRYSRRLDLSAGYIGKIFQQVARAGFTRAVPGPRGGYLLARRPGKIRLIDVIEALDGPLISQCCLLSIEGCSRESDCGVHDAIREGERALARVFERQTLASLARRVRAEQAGPRRPARRVRARGASP